MKKAVNSKLVIGVPRSPYGVSTLAVLGERFFRDEMMGIERS